VKQYFLYRPSSPIAEVWGGKRRDAIGVGSVLDLWLRLGS
jgi:hypothetical protein